MTVYNFILAFLSAGLMFIAIYYFFTIIFIHKKIFDRHFYFVLACLAASFYIFFELMLSLSFSNIYYLYFHRLKMISFMLFGPFYLFTIYSIYLPESNKIIPKLFLIISPFLIILANFDIFISEPIIKIEIRPFYFNIVYHIGQTNFGYTMFSIISLIFLALPLIHYFLSKDQGKRFTFVVIFTLAILTALNDFGFAHGYFNSIMAAEFYLYFLVAFLFYEFIKEDRRTYLKVIELKKEAERRLKLMEIYTRKSLVESIEKGEDPTKFEPNNMQIATLFADIRDFTGISEGMPPMAVVDLLNSYFNKMNSTIIKHHGEIDKLMGDCIMALFKNPDDALTSAIEMRYELAEFNVGGKDRSPLQNGIGINYGEVIMGNIGSDSKMDYTVVGDIVNTASRLEALTKYYKVPLIISEDLKLQLKENYHFRFLDEALIKGKSTAVKIYEVYDFESDENKKIRELNEKPLQEAFTLYQSGDFINAKSIYDDLARRNSDSVLSFYLERCKKLQLQKEAGLLKEWNGVFEFMDK